MTFHPQIDGQIKKVNWVLNQNLKYYVGADPKDWGEHLSLVEFCYNSTMYLATKMSSFELVLGKEARKPMDLAIPMGDKYHSKEVVKMVKGHEEKYPKPRSSLSMLKSGMRSMPIEYEGM
jgi:hypothetical protein